MDLKSRLIDLLHGLGFELVGFARPEQPPHYLTYTKWVEQGLHAGMSYLAAERALERRAHPALSYRKSARCWWPASATPTQMPPPSRRMINLAGEWLPTPGAPTTTI
jgi:epoxyqueuosine reductase QueG